jgi:phospholipase/carboxylesterase
VHGRLREALAVIRAAVVGGFVGYRKARSAAVLPHVLCSALDGHHHGEYRYLFPLSRPRIRTALGATGSHAGSPDDRSSPCRRSKTSPLRPLKTTPSRQIGWVISVEDWAFVRRLVADRLVTADPPPPAAITREPFSEAASSSDGAPVRWASMPTPMHHCCFEADSDTTRAPLVLLHGSYGTESALLPLADRVAPGASRLSVRGTVALDNGYAFFRRREDRRVDETDLASRVPALAALILGFTSRGQFQEPPVAVGFSNGAIMAAALMSTHSGVLAGAVLFRPLPPFAADDSYRPGPTRVLIIDGTHDLRRSPGDGQRLAGKLSRAGAVVTHHVLPVGHSITTEDEQIARDWLTSLRRSE